MSVFQRGNINPRQRAVREGV